MDLSVVIPCLNESETLQICINKIKKQLSENDINGEIIVADNGSTDGSIEIAKKNNVKIINVQPKGYGNALRNGINNANGKYIFVADADNSYDFNEIKRFYNKIIEGYDLVQGCRLPSGGGKIEKGAMPITHRLIGNPLFSFLTKKLFKLKINDVYCGIKIFRRDAYKKMFFFSTGMVFCLEILIKFNQFKYKVCELPTTLYKDGRIKGRSHLKTVSDGLKTLKFLLIFSPKWLFFFPATILLVYSTVSIFHQIFNPNIINIKQLYLSLASIHIAIQVTMLGLYSYLRSEDLGFLRSQRLKILFNFFTLKKSIIISLIGILFSVLNYSFNATHFLNDVNKFIISLFLFLIFINLLFNSLFVALLKENN